MCIIVRPSLCHPSIDRSIAVDRAAAARVGRRHRSNADSHGHLIITNVETFVLRLMRFVCFRTAEFDCRAAAATGGAPGSRLARRTPCRSVTVTVFRFRFHPIISWLRFLRLVVAQRARWFSRRLIFSGRFFPSSLIFNFSSDFLSRLLMSHPNCSARVLAHTLRVIAPLRFVLSMCHLSLNRPPCNRNPPNARGDKGTI